MDAHLPSLIDGAVPGELDVFDVLIAQIPGQRLKLQHVGHPLQRGFGAQAEVFVAQPWHGMAGVQHEKGAAAETLEICSREMQMPTVVEYREPGIQRVTHRQQFQ